ncbi:LAMI_0C00232g1_1 [Lachancea mirantina]|uniref:LAMI_0C00232g1_1 n=1 Tax=Lachancea mirantina TaxID=1230905 RepID=A0A1G4IZI5_9SACH|nr:LAMI_0C00232g1_1 [Lachancea mirantina]
MRLLTVLTRPLMQGSKSLRYVRHIRILRETHVKGLFNSSRSKLATILKSPTFKKSHALTAGSATAAVLGYSLFGAEEQGISVDEVMLHNKPLDCWIVLNGEVYDVTAFLQLHPGGASRIMEVAGNDATEKFYAIHSDSTLERMKSQLVYIGKLKGAFTKVMTEDELRVQENKAKLPPLGWVYNLSDFEGIARKILPRCTFAYFATGSSDEFTIRENHYAYSRVFFRPIILQETGYDVDTSTTFLGTKVDLPIYITAFAGSKWAHPMAELNLQSAAYDANVMQMIPKQNSYSIDEFFAHVPEDQNHWYQYHFDTDEDIKNVGTLIQRLEQEPSVKGLFFNVDLPTIGNREKDTRMRAYNSAESQSLSSIVTSDRNYASLSWKDIENIISSTKLPVCLKGVQRGEDVVLAAERGVKAVVLSNHGGRQLDFSRPPLEVLAEAQQMLKEKNLDGKIEIYLDGGVRRGSDVVKALCLGAKGVGLGRPFLYAMAGYGEDGVTHLLEILKGEVVNNMKLLGVGKVEDLNESLVDATNLKFRNPRVNDVLYDQGYMPLKFPVLEE